jgi:nickel/cobalt transporter (NicO) family protein
MPDLSQIIEIGAAHARFYLPVAAILGALHALEPGHAKSLMAAYIVSIRGTPGQAAVLGLSTAVGHTIVVWVLAIVALLFGQNMIAEQAEPWLTLLSGVLVTLLAVRMFLRLRTGGHNHNHKHYHDDRHPHGHSDDHGLHERQTKNGASSADIVWFGFSGGLLPCPAAIAVLLVCVQLKQFALGIAMVAAFSIGLAATLVAIGLTASWAAKKPAQLCLGLIVWPKGCRIYRQVSL